MKTDVGNNALLILEIKSIDYNFYMQNSVCKRIAKSFQLQRYIPEYQVYELCISWESEIPIPPTIFYLSEIFIYPYNSHQLSTGIKKEIATPINNIFSEPETVGEQDITIIQQVASTPAGSIRIAAPEEGPTSIIKAIDYDKITISKPMMAVIKERNREIVRHTKYKGLADTRKKRKM